MLVSFNFGFITCLSSANLHGLDDALETFVAALA